MGQFIAVQAQIGAVLTPARHQSMPTRFPNQSLDRQGNTTLRLNQDRGIFGPEPNPDRCIVSA